MSYLRRLAMPLLTLTLTPIAGVHAAEVKNIMQTRALSVEAAAKLAWESVQACRKKGYSVAAAVVDRGGNLQAFYRDHFAGPHTTETAIRKAWTANSFRQNTADLAAMLREGHIPGQVQHNPGALLVGGGVGIWSHGELIGGVGVSGAPPGKSERDSIDGACAQAGIEAIQEILEFE